MNESATDESATDESATDERIEVELGSGNVFADLGLPNPEERQMKSLLAIQIRELLDQKGLTEAVRQTGLSDDGMAAVMRGRLSELTLDQLFRCLTRLGRSVEVHILTEPTTPGKAHLTVVMA